MYISVIYIYIYNKKLTKYVNIFVFLFKKYKNNFKNFIYVFDEK